MKNLSISEPTIFNHLTDKENRNNRTDGKRVLDARKPQEGPRESREERNNRRNKQGDSEASTVSQNIQKSAIVWPIPYRQSR